MRGLYCTHVWRTPGELDMPCTRETEHFYCILDKDGLMEEIDLCESCAGFLCPPGGLVEPQLHPEDNSATRT